MKILKITTLEKGWTDGDHLLLHAAFQCLVDFIEKEKPGETTDWEFDKKYRRAWKEIQELYTWWTKERPGRKDPLMDEKLKSPSFKTKKIAATYQLQDYDHKKYAKWDIACKKFVKLEKEWFEEDQKNLHRLVKVRPYLWT